MLSAVTCSFLYWMQSTSDHEDPVYDTVEDMHVGQPLASMENKRLKARK